MGCGGSIGDTDKYKKSYGHIFNQKLYKVIEFIDSNKRNHNIKTMYTVLG